MAWNFILGLLRAGELNHNLQELYCISIKNVQNSYSFEVVSELEFALLLGQIWFDFSICVIDDGQEHVDKNEEYEEHICNEEDWAKDSVGVLNFLEVEVAKDDTEQSIAKRNG